VVTIVSVAACGSSNASFDDTGSSGGVEGGLGFGDGASGDSHGCRKSKADRATKAGAKASERWT
jgi:hypothetical protein